MGFSEIVRPLYPIYDLFYIYRFINIYFIGLFFKTTNSILLFLFYFLTPNFILEYGEKQGIDMLVVFTRLLSFVLIELSIRYGLSRIPSTLQLNSGSGEESGDIFGNFFKLAIKGKYIFDILQKYNITEKKIHKFMMTIGIVEMINLLIFTNEIPKINTNLFFPSFCIVMHACFIMLT